MLTATRPRRGIGALGPTAFDTEALGAANEPDFSADLCELHDAAAGADPRFFERDIVQLGREIFDGDRRLLIDEVGANRPTVAVGQSPSSRQGSKERHGPFAKDGEGTSHERSKQWMVSGACRSFEADLLDQSGAAKHEDTLAQFAHQCRRHPTRPRSMPDLTDELSIECFD